MKRILAIPVTGTLLALVAISLARKPRGETAVPDLSYDYGNAPEHMEPGSGEMNPDAEEIAPDETAPGSVPEKPKEAPKPKEYDLRLEADGTIVDNTTGEPQFNSLDKLIEGIGKVRHTLVISNGDGVTREALDAAEVRLRDHFKVVKVYRAPETPPAEER